MLNHFSRSTSSFLVARAASLILKEKGSMSDTLDKSCNEKDVLAYKFFYRSKKIDKSWYLTFNSWHKSNTLGIVSKSTLNKPTAISTVYKFHLTATNCFEGSFIKPNIHIIVAALICTNRCSKRANGCTKQAIRCLTKANNALKIRTCIYTWFINWQYDLVFVQSYSLML